MIVSWFEVGLVERIKQVGLIIGLLCHNIETGIGRISTIYQTVAVLEEAASSPHILQVWSVGFQVSPFF